ncbi:hypothetical protein [Vibrio sp.]|uniref:hypothetical protein n=1 Tax=Vibrio sp. TaxID=678 RepID=UPI003AA98916
MSLATGSSVCEWRHATNHFYAILTGLAIQALDSRGGPAIRTFKMANEIMMKLVGLVMSLRRTVYCANDSTRCNTGYATR